MKKEFLFDEFIPVFVGGILTGVVISGFIFASDEGSGFISKYQDLIAGILATSAALGTIVVLLRQMSGERSLCLETQR